MQKSTALNVPLERKQRQLAQLNPPVPDGAAMQGGFLASYYGLKYQARCTTDVKGDKDHTSFIIQTLSLWKENEVTAEDESRIQIGDLRKPKIPVK